MNRDVLIIGSGIAGMQAALMLAAAGRRVILVESLPLIGGNTIKNEETFPNLECSTCMVAPIQQDVLQHPRIETLTCAEILSVGGEAGDFRINVLRRARYVDPEACIGCGMCFEPCPVKVPNAWEENLSPRAAIYVPCPGALPNVPAIDPGWCLTLRGETDCSACVESCMFGAIDLTKTDTVETFEVGHILVATGFTPCHGTCLDRYGYGDIPGVYTAMEFERLFASNGPTSGALILRDGVSVPGRIAILFCAGRATLGYCSGVCCMAALKHAHFIRHKLHEAEVFCVHGDICLPEKADQSFFRKVQAEGVSFCQTPEIDGVRVESTPEGLAIIYTDETGSFVRLTVDMVILETGMIPAASTAKLAELAGIATDSTGFIATSLSSPATTSRKGIWVAGCASAPMNIENAVIMAGAAVGGILADDPGRPL